MNAAPPLPLYKRALLARALEVKEQQKANGRKGGFAGRTYPEPKPGDRIGPFEVLETRRGVFGRGDLRVWVKCSCGALEDTFEFNLRKRVARSLGCQHPRRNLKKAR
jgi:hypothetical protein